ncbi:MAG: AsmA-like C-terminal region-containing protein [Rhizobiaceae bacterium]
MLYAKETDANRPAASRWLKWVLLALAALTAALFLLYVSTVAGLSSPALKSRLETGFAAWSGLTVKTNGVVTIGFFPLKATLFDVSATSGAGPLSLESRTVEVRFPVLSLLSNRLEITEVTLSGARIILRPDFSGGLNLMSGRSPLAPPIALARAAIAATPEMPELQSITGDAPGIIHLADSTLSVLWKTGREDRITDLDGTLSWTAILGPASLNVTANWRGEPVAMEASTVSPLLLLSGGTTVSALHVTSKPINLHFDGNTSMQTSLFAQGDIAIQSPSIEKTLAWSEAPVFFEAGLGAVDLKASVEFAESKLALNDLQMTLDGGPASGMLIYDTVAAPPRLSGTLAFDKAELDSMVAAFGSEPGATNRFSAIEGLELDLRLSAETAIAGPVQLDNAAGTIRTSNGEVLLDLGSSSLAGGEFSGSLKLTGPMAQRMGELSVSARGLHPDQLPSADAAFPAVSVPVSLQLEMSGLYSQWSGFQKSATGRLELSAGEGIIRNFSAESFANLASKGAVFTLPETYAGLTPLVSAQIQANIARGAAIIDSADIRFASHAVAVTGALPLLSGGVALAGTITPNADGATGLPFFIGGTWDKPFVTMAGAKP